ncbi:MAG: hypothetical protein HFE65_01955 [Clostridiales bacterium]|jgi:hypothetical protein|nr:hypothetical protein [Clostridiales bacterium]
MINVVVQNKDGETAVLDLTTHYHEIYRSLLAIGYGSPELLRLRDEEDEEYSVKLYSDSDIGNSMIRLLNENDTLYDAYLLDLAVTNAREEIQPDLEQKLLLEQYSTFSEVLEDINQMKIDVAETRLTFFCPLEATIYDEEGYYSPVSNYSILDNRGEIEDRLGIEQLPDLGDMAEYVGNHSGIGEKLIYAVWGLEKIGGKIYGKIDCYLNEELNTEEIEKLRSAISGQNSDGFGELFEQRAIKTDDGDLYVSFWNSSGDYFLYTESEMDEYIGNQHGQQFGGM